MNTNFLGIPTPSRKFLVMLFLWSKLAYTQAQVQPIAPRFQLNFVDAVAQSQTVAFRQENQDDTYYDLVVTKGEEEIFRFGGLNRDTENIYTFTLVNDKFKALDGLKQYATLTTHSNFASEILTAFEHENTAFVGILECRTPNGATSRIQVTQMYSPDDEPSEGLTDVKK